MFFRITINDFLKLIGQSYELAIRKNINPDQPKNLAKVVTVE